MEIKIGSDGGKSCIVTITGQLSTNLPKPEPILFFTQLSGAPRALRLDGVQFAIQEKMGFNLLWILTKDRTSLLLPMESRGGYDFEKIQPLSSPEDSIGIALTSFKVTEKNMSFFIILDMSKQ
jgi:hypothetical protein